MDPYLETDLWTTLHGMLAVEIVRHLVPRLRPKYIAILQRRNVMAVHDDSGEAAPHHSVEVRDVAERRLVTAIEILSPTNKRDRGRPEYLNCRDHFLRGLAHLLEIDLLRAGRRVPMSNPLPPTPYFVLLSRFEKRPMSEVWPVALQDPLPTVPVPLLPGDADVSLELQQLFSTVYDVSGYDLLINYTRPPKGPLSAADGAWIEELLRPRRGA
jgi:hypothetical protein